MATKAAKKKVISKFKKSLMKYLANATLEDLKRRIAIDTGLAKQHLKYKIKGNEIIFYGTDYSKYVEFGTPPHVIRPKNAQVLTIPLKGGQIIKRGGKAYTKFKYGGKQTTTNRVIFAKEVHHPGTRPQPFIRPTFRNDVPDTVKDYVVKMTKGQIDIKWI